MATRTSKAEGLMSKTARREMTKFEGERGNKTVNGINVMGYFNF